MTEKGRRKVISFEESMGGYVRRDTMRKGRLWDFLRAIHMWVENKLDLTRTESCWDCLYAESAGEDRSMCLCWRPSIVADMEDMGMPIVSLCMVSTGCTCDEFEFKKEDE